MTSIVLDWGEKDCVTGTREGPLLLNRKVAGKKKKRG